MVNLINIHTLTYTMIIFCIKVLLNFTTYSEKIIIQTQELMIMIILLLIFKPREQLPAYFNELLFETLRLEFLEIINQNTYKVILPKGIDIYGTKYLNININMSGCNIVNDNVSKSLLPILIINPVFKDNNENNLIDKISITYNR